MTRDMDTIKMSYEEMIDTLKGLVFGTFDRTTAKERDALDMAIKALEQENMLFKSGLLKDCESCKAKQASILDEIRTEIIELRSKQNVGVLECLDIINKYKAGSGVEE